MTSGSPSPHANTQTRSGKGSLRPELAPHCRLSQSHRAQDCRPPGGILHGACQTLLASKPPSRSSWQRSWQMKSCLRDDSTRKPQSLWSSGARLICLCCTLSCRLSKASVSESTSGSTAVRRSWFQAFPSILHPTPCSELTSPRMEPLSSTVRQTTPPSSRNASCPSQRKRGVPHPSSFSNQLPPISCRTWHLQAPHPPTSSSLVFLPRPHSAEDRGPRRPGASRWASKQEE